MAMTDASQLRGVLVAEIDEIAKSLANGGGADLVLQGRALSCLLRIMRPLIERESVQEHECRERMKIIGERLERHEATCPAIRMFAHPAESGGVILANLAKTSLPWLLLIGGLVAWAYFK
jgi:hypothetical protein